MVRIGSPKRSSRAGLILAAVLASLLVVLLLAASLTRAVVLRHRQTRLVQQRQQAFWLAESAVQRALKSLAASPDYRGETWRVAAEALGTAAEGTAEIRVEAVGEPQAGALIRVEAAWPDDPARPIVYRRELFVNLPSPGGST